MVPFKRRTCSLSQNQVALQSTSVGSAWKPEKLPFSNIILCPIVTAGVTIVGILSKYMRPLYPAWFGHGADDLSGCQLEE